MEYVAMIGLLFAPIVCLLCAAWFYVRWQNEHEDQAMAQRDRRTCFIFLIAAAASLVVFGVLQLLFPSRHKTSCTVRRTAKTGKLFCA